MIGERDNTVPTSESVEMTTRPLRIGILVGEASGDILGAGLMAAIQRRYPDAVFEGIGGPRMITEGFNSHYNQERLAVMGLFEPLKRLPELLGIRRGIVRYFTDNPPDVFIGIDSPDFNLTIEERLRAQGITTVHYVSPSVWAWRQKRVLKIARAVDLMLTLLPFEAKFYEQHQVPVTFVGHPLADDIPMEVSSLAARTKLDLPADKKIVALMPGSRGGEVKMLGAEFWAAARLCSQLDPTVFFVVPAANAARRSQIEKQLKSECGEQEPLPLAVVDGQSHDVMAAADLVMMASGTTTLEAMLLKRPMIVTYKFARLSFAIFSRLVKTPFFSLPNLLAGEKLVPELLQDEVEPQNLCELMLTSLYDTEASERLKSRFTELHQQIRQDASQQAAEAVLNLIDAGIQRDAQGAN